jgi:hypothetical protein
MLPRHRLAPCFARFHTGPALLLVLVGLVSGVEGASRKPESAPPPGSDPWHRDDPPGNDACEQALWIQDDTVDFTTQGATTDGPPHATCQFDGQVYNDIWFRTTAPLTGLLWLTLCGSGYDTDLAVYTGWACPVDDSRLLGCNDDGCPGNGAARYRSRLALTVTQGQDLLLRVGGYGTWDRGPGELELEWEENPLGCPLAAELTGPGQFAGTTEGAWQLGSADCGYSTWSPARIVRLLPDEGGSWLASLCGSGYDTVLSVHTDCPPTAANQLACNDDACGLASEVAFDAQAGTPVYLRISGYNGDQGAFQLQLEAPAAPAPANDACDQALVIGPGFHSLSTVSATPDGPGLPGGCGDQPDPGFGGGHLVPVHGPGPGYAGAGPL